MSALVHDSVSECIWAVGRLGCEDGGTAPTLKPKDGGTGGTRMVHRRQLFAKLLMLDAEDCIAGESRKPRHSCERSFQLKP